jgi:hypothetical protein
MPQVTDGGSVVQPIVGFHSVALNPIGGGASTVVVWRALLGVAVV